MNKRKEIISLKTGPKSSGSYSRAVRYGDLLFISGLTPKNADGTSFSGSAEQETVNVLESIGKILKDAGTNYDNVLKVTVALQDNKDWAIMNEVFARYFPKEPPARTTLQSNIGAKVEMDIIASV